MKKVVVIIITTTFYLICQIYMDIYIIKSHSYVQMGGKQVNKSETDTNHTFTNFL